MEVDSQKEEVSYIKTKIVTFEGTCMVKQYVGPLIESANSIILSICTTFCLISRYSFLSCIVELGLKRSKLTAL